MDSLKNLEPNSIVVVVQLVGHFSLLESKVRKQCLGEKIQQYSLLSGKTVGHQLDRGF